MIHLNAGVTNSFRARVGGLNAQTAPRFSAETAAQIAWPDKLTPGSRYVLDHHYYGGPVRCVLKLDHAKSGASPAQNLKDLQSLACQQRETVSVSYFSIPDITTLRAVHELPFVTGIRLIQRP